MLQLILLILSTTFLKNFVRITKLMQYILTDFEKAFDKVPHRRFPPRLHLTTSKVMVIVWRLRGNIIGTVLYIANVLPLQWAQLTKTVRTAWLGLAFVFLCFLGCTICLYVGVCFVYLGQLSHFSSCFGAGVTNLNEPPSSCLLPPRRCGLGAGSIPLRAIVNKKQCEMRGLFMSLVIHY